MKDLKIMDSQEVIYRQSDKSVQVFCKRLVDIAVSAIALIILSPIYLVVTLCIYIEDGRPALFKQPRSGKRDTIFDIYKFRSMKQCTDFADKETNENIYDWKNGVPDDFMFKVASTQNPNVTRVGKVIRKFSIDELPQFYNVLKGDMSIVGPRPEIEEITACYSNRQRMRLSVKPGITGWAQVNGRSSLNHGEKIKHDIYYVHHFNLLLDIKIIFKTVYLVITGRDSV